MTNFYKVEIMNRFNDDNVTMIKYFTTKTKAIAYANNLNAMYNDAEKRGDYGNMVYHIDIDHGITEIVADE